MKRLQNKRHGLHKAGLEVKRTKDSVSVASCQKVNGLELTFVVRSKALSQQVFTVRPSFLTIRGAI